MLLKDKDEETDLIEQAELIFSMARFIMNDEKIKEKPLYHFSSESYYLNIYKDYIELYGYEYSIKNENLGKYEMNFISRIERILCSNGNIEIYYEGKIYIIPNLKHVELIEYQFIDFLGRYKEKILKNEY